MSYAQHERGAFRCFKRATWRRNDSWPDGYEPNPVPMDECRTLARFDNRDDARDWCEERNEVWRKHADRVRNGTASETQRRVYYQSARYEFTEEA